MPNLARQGGDRRPDRNPRAALADVPRDGAGAVRHDKLVTFQWERLRDLLADPNLPALLDEHWREAGLYQDEMPLDPDFGRFVMLNEQGAYRIWTARAGGELVGYAGWFVQPHLHRRSVISAVQDMALLSKAYRRGSTGTWLFNTALNALREIGVKWVLTESVPLATRDPRVVDRFFRGLGFEPIGTLYSRLL